MAIFSDDFERANGAIGGNWYNPSSHFTIAGGYVSSATTHGTYDTTISDTQFLSATAYVLVGAHASRVCGPAVKFSAASFGCYYAACYYSAPNWTFQISYYNGVSVVSLASTTLGSAPPPYSKLYIEWNLGSLTARLNDGDELTATHNDLAAGGYGGFFQYLDVSKLASIFLASGSSVGLSADPEVVGNYGTCTDIDLTGTNTSWVAGTPGSPIFTVNHGTISAQTVVDATHATITYCPGDYLGAVTITDPSTGETVGIIVTSDPAIVPPSDNERPSVAGAALIDHAADLYAASRMLTEDTVIVPAGPAPALGLVQTLWEVWANTKYDFANPTTGANVGLAIYKLWYALNAAQGDWVGPWANIKSEPVAQTLGFLLDLFLNAEGTEYIPIRDIPGGGSDVDLTPILDAIGISWFDPDYTLHDDLDYLDNRSDHSLDQIQTRLGNMWGTDHWSLSQIVGAAGDPQIESFASLHNIYARIQAMRGDSTSTVANAEDWANLANTNAAAAHSAIDAMRTAENLTLQDILDRLDSLTNQVAAISTVVPPVWPGVAHATVYSPYNLADGLTVQGPLHGLLFTITGQPAGAGRYRFGAHNSWTKTGACIFTSDRGDHERAQQFGLDAHIVCPKEMQSAASATLRLNTGWTGTVRRFTID